MQIGIGEDIYDDETDKRKKGTTSIRIADPTKSAADKADQRR